MYNVVFDTQIFLRALISRRSPSHRLLVDKNHAYVLHVSEGIIDEVLDVLTRPKLRGKFPQISDEDVDFVRRMLSRAIQIPLTSDEIEPVCRDPKDDIFLAVAKKAGADYLVSEDKDLLVLKQYVETQIVTVTAFLEVLK